MMIFRACAAVISFALFFPVETVAAAPSIAHHDLVLALQPRDATLVATDTLKLLPRGNTEIALMLKAGARVKQVSASGKPIPFTFRSGTLNFPVPEAARTGTWDVTIAYEAKFDDPVPDDPVKTEDPGYGVTGAITPRGVFLGEGAGWYPDLPGSAPTWRVRIEAAEGFEAITAGKLLRRSASEGATFSEWEISRPQDGLSLSAGKYRIREKSEGDIRLYSYFYPENDGLSEKYLAAAAGFLDLYRDLFGPYPFDKFAVVENFFPTGYGFPSYTLLGSTVLRLPFIAETSLGHEIAHSWWGNGVWVDPGRGNWSEGIVTYMADHLYKERSSPAEGRAYRLNILRDYATLVPPELDFPLKEFRTRTSQASRAVGYGKAAMVFHMARRQAGDTAFRAGLRSMVREKLFNTASWDDFDRAIFGEDKGDASPFFRQWVDRPGAPMLAWKDVSVERDGEGWKVSARLVQEKPYYKLRVPVRLETDGKTIETILPIDGGEVPFELSADSRPSRLIADPDVDVFRRLDPSEIPPLINGVRGSASLVVMASRGLQSEIIEASRELLASLGKDTANIVREEDTPPSTLAGRDVLYLGLPRGSGYLPALPGELSATPSGFTLEGKAYESQGAALFAVLAHPSDKGRVAALFLPLSPEAAALAGRKIIHYGKYSFLSFERGVNRAKGTWPVTLSPTVHAFPSALK